MTTQSIAQEEIQRSIDLTGFWGKSEVREALRELMERITYREAREANGDYLRGFRDGMESVKNAQRE
jgi:hypothetical protein